MRRFLSNLLIFLSFLTFSAFAHSQDQKIKGVVLNLSTTQVDYISQLIHPDNRTDSHYKPESPILIEPGKYLVPTQTIYYLIDYRGLLEVQTENLKVPAGFQKERLEDIFSETTSQDAILRQKEFQISKQKGVIISITESDAKAEHLFFDLAMRMIYLSSIETFQAIEAENANLPPLSELNFLKRLALMGSLEVAKFWAGEESIQPKEGRFLTMAILINAQRIGMRLAGFILTQLGLEFLGGGLIILPKGKIIRAGFRTIKDWWTSKRLKMYYNISLKDAKELEGKLLGLKDPEKYEFHAVKQTIDSEREIIIPVLEKFKPIKWIKNRPRTKVDKDALSNVKEEVLPHMIESDFKRFVDIRFRIDAFNKGGSDFVAREIMFKKAAQDPEAIKKLQSYFHYEAANLEDRVQLILGLRSLLQVIKSDVTNQRIGVFKLVMGWFQVKVKNYVIDKLAFNPNLFRSKTEIFYNPYKIELNHLEDLHNKIEDYKYEYLASIINNNPYSEAKVAKKQREFMEEIRKTRVRMSEAKKKLNTYWNSGSFCGAAMSF